MELAEWDCEAHRAGRGAGGVEERREGWCLGDAIFVEEDVGGLEIQVEHRQLALVQVEDPDRNLPREPLCNLL